MKKTNVNKLIPTTNVSKALLMKSTPFKADEMVIRMRIATKSWTIKNPIEIRPYSVSISPSYDHFIIIKWCGFNEQSL